MPALGFSSDTVDFLLVDYYNPMFLFPCMEDRSDHRHSDGNRRFLDDSVSIRILKTCLNTHSKNYY